MIDDRNARLLQLQLLWELREQRARFHIRRKQTEHEHLTQQLALSLVETEALAKEIRARAALDQQQTGQVDGARRLALDRRFQTELAHRLLDSHSVLDQRRRCEIAARNELTARRLEHCHLQMKRQFLQRSVDRVQCKP